MSLPAIIQARMNSRRMPGKVLRELGGKPLIGRVLERVGSSAAISRIIVATSEAASDAGLVDYCSRCGIEFFCGSLDNVAKRFRDLVVRHRLDAFVRVCADSPFIDPALINNAVAIFEKGGYDIVTNTLKRTFPRGESCEVISSAAFLKGYALMKEPEDLEHVTGYFYRHAGDFRIFNFTNDDGDCSGTSLCVDTPDDFRVAESLVCLAGERFPALGWKELAGMRREIIQKEAVNEA